jgi:hypothetical protein
MDDDAETPDEISEHAGDHTDTGEAAAGVEPSGHPAVDAVLASIEGLEERPVAEHVAVFEDAHDALRRALNDAGEG